MLFTIKYKVLNIKITVKAFIEIIVYDSNYYYFESPFFSPKSPIKVFRGDVTGQVYDGPGDTSTDLDFQKDSTAITFSFTQFESSKDGIAAVEWAVGSQPLCDDVRAFGHVGIVFDPSTQNPGSGKITSGTPHHKFLTSNQSL